MDNGSAYPAYVVCGYSRHGMWTQTGLYSENYEIAQRKADDLTKETGRVHSPEPLAAIHYND